MFGGIAAGLAAGGLGILGSYMTNQFNSKEAQKDRDFQKEVYQNQIQWKSADAKKAGLHPLSVIGTGSYSASPSSVPSSDYSSSMGKLGEGIGDAFTAYMTKDEIAKEAAWRDEQRQSERLKTAASIRESNARTEMYSAQAMESAKRALSYSKPMATGRETIPGQVDANEVKPQMQKFRKPDGTLTRWVPGNDYQEVHSDVPLVEFVPHLESLYWNYRDWVGSQRGNPPGYYYPRSSR